MLYNVLNRVNLKQVVHALHNNCKSFKSHTGVNVRVRERIVISVIVLVKLRKHKVPNLHISVAVAAYAAGRLAAAVFFAAVIVNLRAGATRSCAVLPEVVVLAELHNSACINTNLVYPNISRLVIVLVNRNPELVRRYLHNLCEKLPRPRCRFVLEVVAEREVSEHFKECSVTRGLSDILNIARSYTLLARCNASSRRGFGVLEPHLHRRHTRIYEQQARIIFRYQWKTAKPQAALCFKKT